MKVLLMDHAFGPPTYGSEGAVGLDIAAAEDMWIPPGERRTVKTGLKFELFPMTELQIRSRSGLAHNHGLLVLNSPGTVDPDYRGELMIILFNTSNEGFKVTRGMRIAQAVPAVVIKPKFQVVKALSETKRGEGRFGSTGS